MYEKNINIIMGNQIATSYVRKRDCYNQLKGFMQHGISWKDLCFIWPTKNRKNSNDVSVYIRTIG